MNDYYTTEKLMKRIYHELFGDREAKTLTALDRARLAGHIKPLLKNTISDNQLNQYVTHNWKTDWKQFVSEMLLNSAYNVTRVCPVETVVIAGLPGTGAEFVQRYTHNIANSLPQDTRSFRAINKSTPELYEIQQLIHKPKFDFDKSFNMIEQYAENQKLRTVVLSITQWNKHIINWLGYFKDMSVLKILPMSHVGKHLASRMQHVVLETHVQNDLRNVRMETSVQGDFKNSYFNSWYNKNVIHDMSLLNNKADNSYHHWFSVDTFHPTDVLSLDLLATNNMLFANGYSQFLQEVPGVDQKRKKEFAEAMVNLWVQTLKAEFKGFVI